VLHDLRDSLSFLPIATTLRVRNKLQALEQATDSDALRVFFRATLRLLNEEIDERQDEVDEFKRPAQRRPGAIGNKR
jgi:hypothetical protein